MQNEHMIKLLNDAGRFNEAEKLAKDVGLDYARPTEEDVPTGETGSDPDESSEEEGSTEEEGSVEEIGEEEGTSETGSS